MTRIFGHIVALCAVALLIAACGSESESQNSPEATAQAGNRTNEQATQNNSSRISQISFTLEDVTGEERTADEWIGEQPVVLNFWGSWCGFCRKETPDLVKLYDEYKPKGIEILGMTLRDTPEKAQAFADQYGMEWPLLMADLGLAQRFGIRGAPTTIFIDAEGNIIQVPDANGQMVDRFTGARDYETFKRAFEVLLEKSSAS